MLFKQIRLSPCGETDVVMQHGRKKNSLWEILKNSNDFNWEKQTREFIEISLPVLLERLEKITFISELVQRADSSAALP